MFDCESCCAEVAGKIDDATCRGCGMVICQECCDVFDHIESGLHGRGDPREAVAVLRKQLNAIECTEDDIFNPENVELATLPAAQLEALKRELIDLRRLLTDFVEVARESNGIVGWHLNGAVAEWEEFEFYVEADALITPTDGTES